MGVLTLMRRVRLKTIRRAITHAKGVRLWQYLSIGLFGVFLGSISFFVSLFMFGSLASVADGELAVRVLAGFCTAAVLALVFTGLATALYTMYLSKDLDLLLSLPIKERTIFAYKFWETLAGNSAFFVALGVPALIAYGVATGASLLYYLALPARRGTAPDDPDRDLRAAHHAAHAPDPGEPGPGTRGRPGGTSDRRFLPVVVPLRRRVGLRAGAGRGG